MAVWSISGKTITYNGKVNIWKEAKPGPYIGQIKFLILGSDKGEKETITVFLKDLKPPKDSRFSKGMLKSRTAFMEYLNSETNDEKQDARKNEATELTPGATGAVQQHEKKDDTKGFFSQSAEEVQESKETEDKKLIGLHVLIHIDNLVLPAKERQLREINAQHVQTLKLEFERDFQNFNPLLGVLFGEVPRNLDELATAGTCKVEVLGGNHSISALRIMEQSTKPKTVPIRLYHGLHDEECLKLAFKHNEILEHSKQTTWTDKCILARNLLEIAKNEMTGKKASIEWKRKLSYVFSMDKKTLNNSHRVLLHLAALDDHVWDEVAALFRLWERREIKKAPPTDLKQHHLNHLSKCKDAQQKINLLKKLNKKEINYPEFLEILKGSEKRELLPEEKEQENEEDTNEMQEVKENGTDQSCTSGRTESLVNYSVEELRKENVRLKGKVKQLTEEVQKMEQSVKKEASEKRTVSTELMKLKEKARDFEKLLQMERKKNESLKKELSQKQEDYEYTMKSSREENRKLKSQLYLARFKDSRANSETEERKNKESTKKAIDEVHEEENNEGILGDEIECAVVEYNRGKLYLGKLYGSELTFGKKPLGKKNENIKFEINAQKINMNDVQKINFEYIIIQFKTTIINEIIQITEEQKLEIRNAVNKYSELSL